MAPAVASVPASALVEAAVGASVPASALVEARWGLILTRLG
jgi:hypothetical protein